ncbi:MAG: hypothetical protein QM691_15370 [Opitutaceae bacterium]
MHTPRRELLRRWSLAIGCFALLLFFFSPSLGAYKAWSHAPELTGMLEVRRGASVLWQMDHLGEPVPDPLHGAIQWRLLFPLVGHALGLSPWPFFALAPLGGLAVLAFAITVLRRRDAGWSECALATVILGVGGWFFATVGWLGYFDAWVVLGLLLVAFARSRWTVWLACLWAPWIDERFVLGLPLALLCGHFFRGRGVVASNDLRAGWKSEYGIPAALGLAFVLVRLGVLAGATGGNAAPATYLDALHLGGTPMGRIALGAWEGLRAGWMFVALALALLWPNRREAFGLLATAAAVAAVALATAQDFGRALMLLAPVPLLGAVLAVERRPAWLAVALRIGAAATLLLPGHQVMNDRVNPVFYLYHELAALRTPPAIAMPQLYELRAIHAMEAGDFVRAEADLTLAIKLSEHPAAPHKQRGVLYASAGRWGDAQRDFSAMVDCDPQNPESWFFRAQANLALGDAGAARRDLEQAFTLAPDSWKERADVKRFATRLGSSR